MQRPAPLSGERAGGVNTRHPLSEGQTIYLDGRAHLPGGQSRWPFLLRRHGVATSGSGCRRGRTRSTNFGEHSLPDGRCIAARKSPTIRKKTVDRIVRNLMFRAFKSALATACYFPCNQSACIVSKVQNRELL